MPESKTERKKLTVTTVNEVQHVGDKKIPKLVFKASDGQQELQYFIFGKVDLFPYIKKDTAIKADVETSQRENQNDPEHPWIDRKVVQIYQDGKLVSEQRKPWQGGRDSPEQRASIESQVAAKIVAELWIAGKTDEVNPLVVTLKDWLFEKLGVKPQTQGKPPPAPAKPSESQPGKPISDMAENARAEEGLSPKPTTKPFDLKKFMQEFTETRTILENAGQEKWKYDTLLARLSEMTGVSLKSMAAGINKLTDEQRDSLVKELNEDFRKAQ